MPFLDSGEQSLVLVGAFTYVVYLATRRSGRFGNLFTSRSTVELTFKHTLGLDLCGSIRRGFKDWVFALLITNDNSVIQNY